MRHIIFFLICMLFSSNLSYAASENKTIGKEDFAAYRKQLQSVVSEDSFYSEKPAVFHPECNNPRLVEKVLARIEQYYNENPQSSIVDYRKQVLMLKKLKSFSPIDIDSFAPQTNYNVADRLIDIKINEGIKAKDLSLCKSDGDREIYLLIYPQGNYYAVEIINFPGHADSKNFVAVYD